MLKRLLVVLCALAVLGGAVWLRELYRPFRGFAGSVVVVIEPGTGAADVADLLVSKGVILHRLPFLLRYWSSRSSNRLKAGEYLFDQPLRPIDVYRKLVQGDVLLHSVTIPEGSDRFDMARIFDERLGLSRDEFLRATEESSAIRDLDPQAATLEGYLFPDTYRFPRGVKPAAVVATMLARLRNVLESKFPPELRQTPEMLHHVITLASLVEKETPALRERAIIAGVFVRRLETGWPLQCDPTVVYAARLDRRPIGPIVQSDLDFDSPYNTYRRVGLPPGPIASPGEASIRAALEPTESAYLYFVSDNQGGHVFAKTLADHQRNVARYRRQVAELRRASERASLLSAPPASPKRLGGTNAATSARKGAKTQQQKAAHSRLLPAARSGTPRGARDPER